jgi:hypothetical protein
MLLNVYDSITIENSIISQRNNNECRFLDIAIRSNSSISIKNITLAKSSNTYKGKTIAQIFMLESKMVDLNQSKFEFNNISLANLLTIRADAINLTDVSFRKNKMLFGIMLSIDPRMTKLDGTGLYFQNNNLTST